MKNFHLIYNTHWDREWRWSFRETQYRLKYAMDLLLDSMLADERFYTFHTDSQTSMIDDYLEIRPERIEDIKKLVKNRRLMVGPWYTLPSHLQVNAESIVRNLLIGHKMGNDFGGVMKAGYNIFSFGQPSQLPQIYTQFGMDTIIFYRGIDKTNVENLEFFWVGPDGTRVLGITYGEAIRLNFMAFCYSRYLFGEDGQNFKPSENNYITHICDDKTYDRNHHFIRQSRAYDFDGAVDGVKDLVHSLRKASTDEVLVSQGGDLENPDPLVCDLIDYLNEHNTYGKFIVDTIPEFIEAVKAALKKNGKWDKLKVYHNEMLASDKIAPVTPEVFSARMPVKLANFKAETNMFKYAEPLNCMSFMLGAEYEKELLDIAVKNMCKVQQHDGIGGCHTDRIFESTMELYRETNDITNTVSRASMEHIADRLDCSELGPDEVGVIAFNTTNYKADGIEILTVDMPVYDVHTAFGGMAPDNKGLEVTDFENNPCQIQIIEQTEETMFAKRINFGFAILPVIRYKFALKYNIVQPFGIHKYKVKMTNTLNRRSNDMIKSVNSMENEFVKVNIKFDGTINILDKQTNQEYNGLNYYEDTGEAGYHLHHKKPAYNQTIYSIDKPANISLITAGKLLTQYKVVTEMEIPEGLEQDMKRHIITLGNTIEHGQLKRSERKVILRITTIVTLKMGDKKVCFDTSVNNQAKNHRLRMVFPTNADTDVSKSDTIFDIATRPIHQTDSTEQHERSSSTYPTQSFVGLFGKKRSLAVLHKGIASYKVHEDKTLYMDLLRTFEVSGGNLESHKEEILTQCLGDNKYEYAIIVGETDLDTIKHSNAFFVPPKFIQTTMHSGDIKNGDFSIFSFDNENICFTASKLSEDKEGIIVRFFNPTDNVINFTFSSFVSIKNTKKVTLEEKDIKELETDGKTVSDSVRGKEIYSLYFELREK